MITKNELVKLLNESYIKQAGASNLKIAIRDCLTDIVLLCNENNFDMEDILLDANEVAGIEQAEATEYDD